MGRVRRDFEGQISPLPTGLKRPWSEKNVLVDSNQCSCRLTYKLKRLYVSSVVVAVVVVLKTTSENIIRNLYENLVNKWVFLIICFANICIKYNFVFWIHFNLKAKQTYNEFLVSYFSIEFQWISVTEGEPPSLFFYLTRNDNVDIFWYFFFHCISLCST